MAATLLIVSSPGSGCLVFGLGSRVIKLPRSIRAIGGLRRERQGEIRALSDEFWRRYCVAGIFPGRIMKIARRLRPLSDKRLLDNLLVELRERAENVPPAPEDWAALYPRLADLQTDVRDLNRWIATLFLGERSASAHGDFCSANCLCDEGQLALIDWGGFRPVFWSDYDHVHFGIVEQSGGAPWREGLAAAVDQGLSNALAARYLVCRSELEMDQDIAMKRLTLKRRKKYLDTITWAMTELCPP